MTQRSSLCLLRLLPIPRRLFLCLLRPLRLHPHPAESAREFRSNHLLPLSLPPPRQLRIRNPTKGTTKPTTPTPTHHSPKLQTTMKIDPRCIVCPSFMTINLMYLPQTMNPIPITQTAMKTLQTAEPRRLHLPLPLLLAKFQSPNGTRIKNGSQVGG